MSGKVSLPPLPKNKITPKGGLIPVQPKEEFAQTATSHFSQKPQEAEETIHSKISAFFSGRMETVIDTIGLVLCSLTYVIHIADTYDGRIYEKILSADIGVMIYFLLEFLQQLYLAQHRMMFLLDILTLTKISTFVPLTYIFKDYKIDVIYKLTIVARSTRIVRYSLKYINAGFKDEVWRQMYTIYFTIFASVIITASVIQVFEADYRPTEVISEK